MTRAHLHYCDELNIDLNIQRFLGALEKVAHERKKALEFSLTGVKVKIEETDKTRPLTIYEKIELLEELLSKCEVLANSRPTHRTGNPEFVKERCRAVRVEVPQVAADAIENPAFTFWVSLGNETRGLLCAMEGDGGDRENPYNYGRSSTFTVLQSLVHFSRAQGRAGVIDHFVPNKAHPNEYAKVDATHPPSLVEQYHNVEEFKYDFATDPLCLMKKWGCKIASGRDVNILYRIREFGPDSAHGWNIVTAFGYALVVEDASP